MYCFHCAFRIVKLTEKYLLLIFFRFLSQGTIQGVFRTLSSVYHGVLGGLFPPYALPPNLFKPQGFAPVPVFVDPRKCWKVEEIIPKSLYPVGKKNVDTCMVKPEQNALKKYPKNEDLNY